MTPSSPPPPTGPTPNILMSTMLPAWPCQVFFVGLATVETPDGAGVHWLTIRYATRGKIFTEVFSGKDCVDLVEQLTERVGFDGLAAATIVSIAASAQVHHPKGYETQDRKN